MASNSFLRMLFGQGTEPSYGGLRVPRQRVEDDSQFIRLGNPQERFRKYHSPDNRRSATSGNDEAVVVAESSAELPDNSKSGRLQGAITGIGSMLSQAFADAQQPQKPLEFAQLQQQQMIPLIDPRFMPRRENGGPVKKKRPYIVGEDGPEIIIPNEDGVVIPNRRNINWDVQETAEQPVTFPEEVTATEQVTPTTVTETVTEQEPSIADVLRAKIDERQQRLAEGATKNADGTTTYGGKQYRKRNWKDALKSAGLGMLQSLATAQVNPNDPNPLSSMLGRAIGGAGAGGVMGATMNNVDERMMDKMKLAQLVPQYKQATQQEEDVLNRDAKVAQIEEIRRRPEKERATREQQTRLQELRGRQAVDRINQNADIKAGIATPVYNEDGNLEFEYRNVDSQGKRRPNELQLGSDGKPFFVAGEQGVTWVDPLTKQPIRVKAKQTLMPGATIATGNANRDTAAARDNAEKYWQTQKTNIDNQMKYMSDIKGLLTAAITADSGMVDDPGTRAEMEGKYNEIVALSNSPLPDTDDPSKAQEDRVKRVNKLTDDYNQLNNKLLDNLSKTAVGKAKADQIRQQIQNMERPDKLTYTPYTPTMVTGGITGKPVDPKKDPMGLYR